MTGFYIGTYTRLGGPGVARAEFDGKDISVLEAEASLNDPSYVILSRDGRRLFAIAGGEKRGDPGYAASYDVSGGELRVEAKVGMPGTGPCHLCLSPDERFLYAANYASGNIVALPIQEAGLGAPHQMIQHSGGGPVSGRQDAAHAHQVGFLPGSNMLWAVDLGMDAVMVYRQDPETGLLYTADRLNVPAGLGPRHLAFAPDGINGYLAHELGSAVSHIRWDGVRLSLIGTWSTLPEGYSDGENTCAAVRIGEGGKRVYVSNRGHNSLARFTVLPDGRLAADGYLQTFGESPRDFALLGRGLAAVAHQDTGDITVIDISGSESRAVASAAVAGAVCVCPY